MSTPAKSIDAYLAQWSETKRAALERLRGDIRSAAPTAVECISYGIPAFKLDGKLLVAFGAAAKHCALYPGAHPIEAHAQELAAYDTSKGTVRFPDDRPLPARLVRRLVETRAQELAASAATRAAARPTAKRGARSGR